MRERSALFAALFMLVPLNAAGSDSADMDWLLYQEPGTRVGLDMAVEYREENYRREPFEAQIRTQRYTLTPWVGGEHFSAYASVPYASLDAEAEGTVVIERSFRNFSVSRPVTLSADRSEEGLEDITAGMMAQTAARQGMGAYAGLDYKFDNGDTDANLGSGTRDSIARAGLTWLAPEWDLWLEGGYLWSESGDREGIDRAIAGAGLNLYPLDWLSLEARYSYEAESGELDSYEEWQAGPGFRITDDLELSAYWHDRPDNEDLTSEWSLLLVYHL